MQQPYRISLSQSPVSVRMVTVTSESLSGRHVTEPAPATPSNEELIAEQLNYLQQLLNDIGTAIEELQQQHRESLAELQQTTVELSIAAASWIVGAAIDADMFAVDDLVASMVRHLHKEQPVRIYLNPEDASLLNHLIENSEASQLVAADVEVASDAELTRGKCRVESARTTLVTDLDDRLADIRRIWMENLNETQTERRADDPAGRGFRRFPDRRHTA
jgi:flagellar biosynthesis/type III secretory pathway protein FliH